MKCFDKSLKSGIRESRFPPSLFAIYLVVLLFMSGIHSGLLVLMETLKWNALAQTVLPIVYWSAVAIILTVFTRRKMRQSYDDPMRQLAEATDKVAHGDFSVYVSPTHTPDKQDYLDIMIMDFNKMVEELGSIETLKTDFFSNVSHEIKTPLSIIQNYAELLWGDPLSEELRKEYSEAILHATKRLSALITNMLKLSKLEKQVISAVPERYDICAQLCGCALQFEEIWEKQGIEFNAEIEESCWMDADKGLLELVWTNLLSNAFKFTREGGTVTLRQTSDSQKIVVSVSDTGCGMDGETIRHIFDKFYQGDTSHAMEGNGLGLSLVKRILELSEGTVTVDSTLGKGTVFTVILPRSVREGRSAL